MTSKELWKKYRYIVAWGIYTGSYDYYIDEQVRLAEREGAPVNAIFKRALSGEWALFQDLYEGGQAAVNIIIEGRGL